MPRYRTIRNINNIAWKTLQNSGIEGPKVNPRIVAEHLGIEVKEYDLGDEISGLLVIRDGKVVIGVHKIHHPNRQNFSIAHEIGHYVLDHESQGMFVDKNMQNFSIYHRNSLTSQGTDRQEREANAFAAALLMPEKFLRNEIDRVIAEEVENQNAYFDLSGGSDSTDTFNDDQNPFITKLAKTFGVSPMAMTYRIGNLNLFDAL